MAARRKRKKKNEPAHERGRRPLATKLLYVVALLAVGGGAGLVLGSIMETPRLVLAWLSGPVQQIDLAPTVVEVDDTTLEEFREMQSTRPAPPRAPETKLEVPSVPPAATSIVKSPRSRPAKPPASASVVARVEPPKAETPQRRGPSQPAVSSGVRTLAQATKSHAQIIAELEARTRPVSVPTGTQPASRARRGAVVQIAAHATSALAEAQAARLRVSGFDAYVSNTRPKANKSRYRVRVRPRSPESTKELATRLRARGFDTWTTAE